MSDACHHTYSGGVGKDVEVKVDGYWYPGEVRSWDRSSVDGSWSGIVTWHVRPGETRIDRFPAERIRPAADAD